jgi:hypothetical protein
VADGGLGDASLPHRCAIGEVLGMVLGTALGWSNLATVLASIGLAFVFGYLLTMRGGLKAGLTVPAAGRLALGADTVSIAVMELVDNAVVIPVPGALAAGLTSAACSGAAWPRRSPSPLSSPCR